MKLCDQLFKPCGSDKKINKNSPFKWLLSIFYKLDDGEDLYDSGTGVFTLNIKPYLIYLAG